jgi:hypothetical protein
MAYQTDARETKNKMSSFKIKKTDPLFSAPLSMFEIDNSASLNKKKHSRITRLAQRTKRRKHIESWG